MNFLQVFKNVLETIYVPRTEITFEKASSQEKKQWGQ